MQNVENANADMKRLEHILPSICFKCTNTLNCFDKWTLNNEFYFSFENRYLDEKEKSLQEALQNIQILEKDIAEKDAEVKFL